jgi:5-methylcytosine-specific restriction endonuclease McrA
LLRDISKTCTHEGCSLPRFSKGLCQKHWKQSYGKSINKVSAKGKAKQAKKKSLHESDRVFYERVWEANAHVCYECNEVLLYPSLLYFHHMLPKRSYPRFRHTMENIVLLCWSCHNQVETFADKCPRTKALTEEIRKQLLG